MADAGAAGYFASVADFRSAQAFLIRGLQNQGDSISAAFAIDKLKTWVDLRRRDGSSLRLGKADCAEPVSGQGRDFLKKYECSILDFVAGILFFPTGYCPCGLSLRLLPLQVTSAIPRQEHVEGICPGIGVQANPVKIHCYSDFRSLQSMSLKPGG